MIPRRHANLQYCYPALVISELGVIAGGGKIGIAAPFVRWRGDESLTKNLLSVASMLTCR